MLDEIAWRYYGTVDPSILRQVLAANPAIADHGAKLPRGVVVILPDIAAPASTRAGVVLWD